MELTLNMEEQELLAEILQERRDTFLREISRAESNEFKKILRRREQLLEGMLERMHLV